MANDNDDIRATLNGLIETLKDGEEGFRTASENSKIAPYPAEFRSFCRTAHAFREPTTGPKSRASAANQKWSESGLRARCIAAGLISKQPLPATTTTRWSPSRTRLKTQQ